MPQLVFVAALSTELEDAGVGVLVSGIAVGATAAEPWVIHLI